MLESYEQKSAFDCLAFHADLAIKDLVHAHESKLAAKMAEVSAGKLVGVCRAYYWAGTLPDEVLEFWKEVGLAWELYASNQYFQVDFRRLAGDAA